MASNINASTSGAGGLITTADNSGNINLQSNGTTVLGVTSGGVAVTGTLSATSTISQNGTNVVAVAPGTNGNVLTSNGTIWTSAAPAASGPVLKLVTDSTDIALTASPPTYYSIGSSFSVSIPTTGIIRVVSFVGRIDNNTLVQGGGPTFGIRIGSTNYWFALVSDNGTDKYYMGIAELNAVGYMATNGSLLNNANATYIKSQCLDIAYNSVPTGTQTVQLICSKTNSTYTDNITLKGTTRTTKVGIEFVSAS